MWKEIPNTDGLYLISDDAKVFSVRSNRLLKPQRNSMGYWRVEFNFNGKVERHLLHRLVAEVFIPNPNNYPCVNHKDENPSNNRADNLEWCTHKYNSNYGTCQKRIQAHRKSPSGADNPQSLTVYQYDLAGNLVAEYGSCGEAGRETGFRASSIARAASGKRKQYNGYFWNYGEKFDYKEPRKRGFKKGAVLKCDSNGKVLKRYETPEELKADGYRQVAVNRVCRGERNEYMGFHWKHEGE